MGSSVFYYVQKKKGKTTVEPCSVGFAMGHVFFAKPRVKVFPLETGNISEALLSVNKSG